jgi:choline dehydrogenase
MHGTDGPVPIFRAGDAALTIVDRAVVAAAEALGFPPVCDFTGSPQQSPGVGPIPKNVSGGVRMNAAFTYLVSARGRPNLTLIADTLIDRVCLDGGRATGVRTADGRVLRGRQVVLSAGAYGSPAILLRSGIGSADDLRGLGIPAVLDRPGVGRHLLDHPMLADLGTSFQVNPPYASAGPSFIPTLIKARSRQSSEEIDLHVYHGLEEAENGWLAGFVASLQYARSQGRVRLTATEPEAPLEIDHGYFTDPADLEALCDGAELIVRLVQTKPLSDAITAGDPQWPPWRDRAELRAWVRDHVATTFPPSSTCRMGPPTDATAFVDHVGRIHGVAGLRVVDASIFPTGPRANLHCTVVAVAERLAEVIADERSEYAAHSMPWT